VVARQRKLLSRHRYRETAQQRPTYSDFVFFPGWPPFFVAGLLVTFSALVLTFIAVVFIEVVFGFSLIIKVDLRPSLV